MSVTLHSPVEGLAAGETYSGPREDWLVAQGYASRDKVDGLHATSVEVAKDPTVAENREAPDEDAPTTTETRQVLGASSDESYRAPDLKAATDSTQPNQKAIDKMLAEVEEGKRDPNAPNVVYADVQKAAQESRDYDGGPVTEIQKRSQERAHADLVALGEQDEKRRVEGIKAARQDQKDRGLGDQTAPAEKVLMSEENRPTGGAKSETEGGEREWALLPELGTNVDVGKQFAADVTQDEKVRADLKADAPKKAAAKSTKKDSE